MKRYAVLLLATFALMACAPQAAQQIVDSFNPQGIGLGDEAIVQRGPQAGEVVTVLGYEGGRKVQTTGGAIAISHLAVDQSTLYWCIGSWEWVDFGDFFAWTPPHTDLLLGTFDFRTEEQASAPGPEPLGVGLFVYSSNPNDLTLTCKADAAEAGRAITSDVEKVLIRTLVRPNLTELVLQPVTICGIMLALATTHAETIGLNPIELGPDGSYHVVLGPLDCNGLPPFI